MPNRSYDSSMALNYTISQIEKQGYWLAKLDSCIANENVLNIYLKRGIRFENFQINLDTQVLRSFPNLMNRVGNKKKHDLISDINTNAINVFDYFINNGYPFVKVFYDSIKIYDGQIHLSQRIQLNNKINFDTLIFDGFKKTSNQYFRAKLNILKGEDYSDKKVFGLNKILKIDNDFDLISEPYVEFLFDKAYVHLNISPKSKYIFHGMVGLFQDANQSKRKTQIVGELNLKFSNLLFRGIYLEAALKKFQLSSQLAKVNFNFPYVGGSKLGLTYELDFLKQDTSFLNVDQKYILSYSINPTLKLGFLGLSRLSSVNDKLRDSSMAQVKMNQLGVSIQNDNVFKTFYPTKGSTLGIELRVGEKSNETKGEVFSTTQFNFEIGSTFYYSLSRRFTLKHRFLVNQAINSKGVIFVNESYRLGGASDLRGFNEKTFYINRMLFNSTEFRYLIDKELYGFTFLDNAILNQNLNVSNLEFPIGMGLGFSYLTKSGAFTFSFALGKSNDQALNIRSPKIHFIFSSNL